METVSNVLTINMQTPHALAEEILKLSEEFSRYSGELAKLIKIQADHFNTYRGEFKSDTQCQRAFEASEKGVQFATVKLKLKSLQQRMSANKTMIRVATEEAHGVY